jgi:hypothetical protein
MIQKQLTSDIVASQIASLDAEITRIDESIAHAQTRKEAILLMKNALLPLVSTQSPAAKAAAKKALGSGNGSSGNVNVALTGAVMSLSGGIVTATHHPTSTGFRDALRGVLRDHPKGLRPREVVKEMEARGEMARYTGKASPATRVANELYDLLNRKVLSRRGGRYSLNMERPNANT